MKLVYASASPFVRKVKVVLHETDQLAETELVKVVTTPVNSAAQAVAANPSGKIPALILDDGQVIYDSRVICRYLDEKAKAGLYPAQEPWRMLTLEATADAIMDAAVLMTYEHRIRPENMVYLPWVDAQWAKIERSLLALNSDWMDILDGDLSIGQIGVGCALNYLDFRHPTRDWRPAVPKLAEWLAEFNGRESMVATRPE